MSQTLPNTLAGSAIPGTGLRLAGRTDGRADPAVVLHVRVVAGRSGGPDKTILRSAALVDPARYQVHAAYIHPHGDPVISGLRDQAAALGCPLHLVPETGPLDPRTITHLLALCRQLGVQLWHGHDYKSNLLGLLLRRMHPMQLVTTAHGWTGETMRTRLYHHVDNLCLRHYPHVMTVSRPIYDHCLHLGLTPRQVTYLPNGIDVDEYRPTRCRAAVRHEWGVPQERKVIGVVGRLSIEKGVDRALRTVARLLAMHHDVQLQLIGDGPERAALEALAESLHITERVRFLGWQKDTRRCYEGMDLLLLPSHTEGMPNVVLEAMAMGVPVAATDVGDVARLLDQGRCGLILAPTADEWSLALGYHLRHPETILRMSAPARRRVAEHYTFARRVARELDVYDRALGRATTAPRLAQAA